MLLLLLSLFIAFAFPEFRHGFVSTFHLVHEVRWQFYDQEVADTTLIGWWLTWSFIATVATAANAFVIVLILRNRGLRRNDFNQLIVALCVSNLCFSVCCSISCFLHAVHRSFFGGRPHCDAQTWYLAFGVGFNIWVNVVISHEVLRMARCIANCEVYQLLGRWQLWSRVLASFLTAATGSSFPFVPGLHIQRLKVFDFMCIPSEEFNRHTAWYFWFFTACLLYLLPLAWVSWNFWQMSNFTQKASASAMTQLTTIGIVRSLYFTFRRILVVLLLLWSPCLVAGYLAPANPHVLFTAGLLIHSQGIVSAVMYCAKADIRARLRAAFRKQEAFASELNMFTATQVSSPKKRPSINLESADQQSQVVGIRLRDLEALMKEHWEWLNHAELNKFTQTWMTKTMYDVSPELLIPATTTEECIVTVRDEDLQSLKPLSQGGVLVSNSDLTLDSADGPAISFGGQSVPKGVTIHGRLRPGGTVRRQYWAEGFFGEGEFVAPEALDLSLNIGEAEDKIRKPSDLEVGDVLVLRQGMSYVDLLALDGRARPIDCFVSHFWGQQSVEFLGALQVHAHRLVQYKYLGARNPGSFSYWICTFCNSQHRVQLGVSLETSPFYLALRYIKETGGAFLMQCWPWQAPFPLKRAWCIFEIYTTKKLGIPFQMQLCPRDRQDFFDALTSNYARVQGAFADIDVKLAAASEESDREMITEQIENDGGFDVINEAVTSVIKGELAALSVRMSLER